MTAPLVRRLCLLSIALLEEVLSRLGPTLPLRALTSLPLLDLDRADGAGETLILLELCSELVVVAVVVEAIPVEGTSMS